MTAVTMGLPIPGAELGLKIVTDSWYQVVLASDKAITFRYDLLICTRCLRRSTGLLMASTF